MGPLSDFSYINLGNYDVSENISSQSILLSLKIGDDTINFYFGQQKSCSYYQNKNQN